METQPRPTPKTDALRDLYENYEYRATVGDIWELCEFFERELNEARAEMIRWMSIAEGRGRTDDDDTGKAMAKLIRQRDEARGQLAGVEDKMRVELRGHPDSKLWGDAGLIAATMRCVDALGQVTDQRDRLAEALQKVVTAWDLAEWLDENDFETFRATLQSLTPNAKQ